jgi:hypothetical protein
LLISPDHKTSNSKFAVKSANPTLAFLFLVAEAGGALLAIIRFGLRNFVVLGENFFAGGGDVSASPISEKIVCNQNYKIAGRMGLWHGASAPHPTY